MRHMIALTTHGFKANNDMRDIVKIASSNMVVVWDEIEQYLDATTESNFKKVLDGNPQKFIDKYETNASTYVPLSLYGATSNKREFRLSDDGSRRIFHIPVTWVDTDTMDCICWHKLINILKREYDELVENGFTPWMLTESQLQQQSQLHHKDLIIILIREG